MSDTNSVRQLLTDTSISETVMEQQQTSMVMLQVACGAMALIMFIAALSVFLRRNNPQFAGKIITIWSNIIGCTLVGILFISGLFGIRYMEEQNREHIDDWYVAEGKVGEIQYYSKTNDHTQYSEYYYTYVPYGNGKKKRIKIFDDAMIDALERDKNAYIIFNYRGTPIYVYSTQLYNYIGDRLQTE